MNLRTKTALLALLWVISCQVGCWLADYTFEWEGELITVYGYEMDESEVCAGSFEALDDRTARVREFLGVDTTGQYYYLWTSPEFFEGLCPDGAAACASENTVISPVLPHMHEVTHVVTIEAWGQSASLLEEGLAVYLDDPRPWQRRLEAAWVQPAQMKERMIEWDPVVADYDVAGHFVSFLVETRGIEAFTRLYRGVDRGSTLRGWEREVPEVYGVSLDQLLAEYVKYPLCSNQEYRARLWGCDGESDHVFTPDDLEYEFEADCSDPRATNLLMGGVFITRMIHVTEMMWIRAKVEIDDEPVSGPVLFMAQECIPCSKLPVVIDEPSDEWTLVYPGNYMIMMTLRTSLGSSIKLTLTAKE